MSDDLIKASDANAMEPATAGAAPTAQGQPILNGPAPLQGMLALPVVKQVGLMLGLAASVALGIAVVLWSQTPDYRLLYAGVDGRDAQRMIEVLDASGIPYRLDAESGALMVAADRLNDARLKLAGENLAPTQGQGFEILDKDSGFGSSTFMQSVRYKRAQEGELARTIMSLNAVQSARVHLAIPKDSAFVRNRRKPSASVMVKLAPGRRLTPEQITSIVNLVAASVPNLTAEEVTLVDDKGRLLSSGDRDRDLMLTASQFDYTRKVEQTYAERIENLLGPLVGLHAVRATVNADIDFTVTELTQERFNPDLPAMRSEQQFEESSSGGITEGGIPGALSNTPPGPAAAPEQAVNPDGANGEATKPEPPKRSVKRTTRNYELDKTISHTRRAPGAIRKLSVAVVLDVPTTTDEEGNVIPKPYSPEELQRFTELVREAVGFNALRGDSVKVINAPFTPVEPPEVPEEAIWEKPWFGSVVRQVLAGLLVLVLLFGVLRPVMRSLAKPPVRYVTETGEEIPEDQLSLSHDGKAAAEGEGSVGRLPKPSSYEDNLNMAKQLASQEPKRVAMVVKGWLEDG